MEIQVRNDIELRECIEKALNLGIGASIEIGGFIYIHDIESGDICVGGNYGPHMKDFVMPKENEVWPSWEEEFTSLDEAIAFFLEYRNEHNLGRDFEVLNDT